MQHSTEIRIKYIAYVHVAEGTEDVAFVSRYVLEKRSRNVRDLEDTTEL